MVLFNLRKLVVSDVVTGRNGHWVIYIEEINILPRIQLCYECEFKNQIISLSF